MWTLIIFAMGTHSAIAVADMVTENACLQAVKKIEEKPVRYGPKYSAICVNKKG